MERSARVAMVVRRLKIESETRHLAAVRAFVEAATAEGGVAAPERRRLALAVDEAVANVMEHGYAGAPGRPIEVEVEVAGGASARVEVRIRDRGPAFDPSAAARGARPVQPGAAASGLRARGYGLLLMSRLVDEIRYVRSAERGTNELHLVRIVGRAAGGSNAEAVP